MPHRIPIYVMHLRSMEQVNWHRPLRHPNVRQVPHMHHQQRQRPQQQLQHWSIVYINMLASVSSINQHRQHRHQFIWDNVGQWSIMANRCWSITDHNRHHRMWPPSPIVPLSVPAVVMPESPIMVMLVASSLLRQHHQHQFRTRAKSISHPFESSLITKKKSTTNRQYTNALVLIDIILLDNEEHFFYGRFFWSTWVKAERATNWTG